MKNQLKKLKMVKCTSVLQKSRGSGHTTEDVPTAPPAKKLKGQVLAPKEYPTSKIIVQCR